MSLTHFRKQKNYTAYDHFQGNGPYGNIPTKKEPITTLGSASRLPYHMIQIIFAEQSFFHEQVIFKLAYIKEVMRD